MSVVVSRATRQTHAVDWLWAQALRALFVDVQPLAEASARAPMQHLRYLLVDQVVDQGSNAWKGRWHDALRGNGSVCQHPRNDGNPGVARRRGTEVPRADAHYARDIRALSAL